MGDLLTTTELTATFKPGSSALGHHWELTDADGESLGKTKRAYSGGALKRGLWRTVTATGMDSGNDIRAEILDAGGTVVANLFSHNDKANRRVEVFDANDSLTGVVHHDDDGFRFEDAGGTVVGRLAVPDAKASPWQLADAAGTPLGIVDRVKAQRVAGPTIGDYLVGISTITDNARDFQNTMHLGFAFSNVYSVSLPALPPLGSVRTLAVLSPVILGYAY